jgi:hypothetical protein
MKFWLDFVTDLVKDAMNEVLPDDDNKSGIFCVIPNCDNKYMVMQHTESRISARLIMLSLKTLLRVYQTMIINNLITMEVEVITRL